MIQPTNKQLKTDAYPYDLSDRDYSNKNNWPKGEWTNEPDYKSWIDEETGYQCAIVRSSHPGILCGYVMLTKNHVFHHLKLDEFDEYIICHGSITYDGTDINGMEERWIGFDCGHAGDLMPAYDHTHQNTYRNFEYVENQCKRLAKQFLEYDNYVKNKEGK